MRADSLGAWVARVFLWMIPSFALWHFASGPLASLQAALATAGANAWFPGLLTGWERDGGMIDFVTRLHASTAGRIGVLVYGVNGRVYSYGLALFVALCLATDPRGWKGLLAGAGALLPVIAWGVLFDLLQHVFIAQGALAARDYLPTPWERNLIALGYQAGVLLLPMAAPVLAWGAVHREFLARRMAP